MKNRASEIVRPKGKKGSQKPKKPRLAEKGKRRMCRSPGRNELSRPEGVIATENILEMLGLLP